MIVRGVVLRFDRQGERFDGAQVQSRNFLGVFLLRIEAAEVGLVGAVDPIDDRENQKCNLPPEQPVNNTHATSDQRTQQIIGKGPQIAFLPNVDGITSLGHGDDAGDGDSVEGKVSGCRRRHQKWPAEPNRCRQSAVEDHFRSGNG